MNSPEYCQGIYEAAKELVEYYDTKNAITIDFNELGERIRSLKRALEGKE